MYLQSSGQPIHTRSLTIDLRRDLESGLVARGAIIDLRKRGLMPTIGGVQCAGIIHHMTLALAIDPLSREIVRVDVDQPTVAFEASAETGGECCRDPAPRLLALAGQRLDAELVRTLSQSFGGPLGCSHLLTLAQLMASALPPALDVEAEQGEMGDVERRTPGERIFHRMLVLDGLEPAEGELCVQVQLNDAHTRPLLPGASPFERVAWQREAQLRVEVEVPGMQITRAEATTRDRDFERFTSTPFQKRDDAVAWLVDRPLFGGMAAETLRRFGSDAGQAPLRDVVLNLAPGTIQCLAATMDRQLEQAMISRTESPGSGEVRRRLRAEAVGGRPDSCYMWRRDGGMAAHREP